MTLTKREEMKAEFLRTGRPPMAEVLEGTDVRDGAIYFFTRRKAPLSIELGGTMTNDSERRVTSGGSKHIVPAGATIQLVAKQLLIDTEEDRSYETQFTHTYEYLWRVKRGHAE